MTDDDIQDVWHAVEKPAAPIRPRPQPVISQVRPVPRGPVLDIKVGDRVTVTKAGRDRTAIVRYFDDATASIDFDPPLPYPAPVGSYLGIKVRRDEITRIVPKPQPPDPKLIRLR